MTIMTLFAASVLTGIAIAALNQLIIQIQKWRKARKEKNKQ